MGDKKKKNKKSLQPALTVLKETTESFNCPWVQNREVVEVGES